MREKKLDAITMNALTNASSKKVSVLHSLKQLTLKF